MDTQGEPIPINDLDAEPPQRVRWSKRRLLGESLFIITVCLIINIIVRTFLIQAFYIPSESMEKTLLIGDRIIASIYDTKRYGVSRGDIIVFEDPGQWLAPQDKPETSTLNTILSKIGIIDKNSGNHLVKRVIGVGGDHVHCCNAQGLIEVNGIPLSDDYTNPEGTSDTIPFDIIVPADNVFVLGDNREHSGDSRYHLQENSGTFSENLIVGKATLIFWPLNRITVLHTPTTFASIPQHDNS